MHEKAGIKESELTQQGILHIGAIFTKSTPNIHGWNSSRETVFAELTGQPAHVIGPAN